MRSGQTNNLTIPQVWAQYDMEADSNPIAEPAEDADSEVSPGRAMRVAAALKAKGGDEFAKPGNIIEIKFVKGESLSLTASRLLALMILTAGGDAWEDRPHRIRKADIRRGHKGNERITDMLQELHRTLFAIDDKSWRGKKATLLFSLISRSKEETNEEGGETGWIEWEFTPDARRLIQASETYAVLNRQAVLGFRSNYALKLYELGALRLHRRQATWRGDMQALRAALGIPPEVYTDFAQLRRKVLEKAKSEIDQLAHFRVEWREFRRGRTVTELEFRFEPKGAPEVLETVDELDRHSLGRQARRDGIVEKLKAEPAAISPHQATPPPKVQHEQTFPTGSLRFGHDDLLKIGREHGGGWDVDLIASGFRSHMGDRLEKLRGGKLIAAWKGFCEGWVNRRGRP
jgi:hypothetical protein